jgi:hypothetical protein
MDGSLVLVGAILCIVIPILSIFIPVFRMRGLIWFVVVLGAVLILLGIDIDRVERSVAVGSALFLGIVLYPQGVPFKVVISALVGLISALLVFFMG